MRSVMLKTSSAPVWLLRRGDFLLCFMMLESIVISVSSRLIGVCLGVGSAYVVK